MSEVKSLTVPVNRYRDLGHLCLGLGTGIMLCCTYAVHVYGAHVSGFMLSASTLNLVAAYLIIRSR